MPKSKQIVDVRTGEVLDLDTAPVEVISASLTAINKRRRDLDKLEKAIKSHIKKQDLKFEPNESGTEEAFYGDHRIQKTYRRSFDARGFAEKANMEEKGLIEKAEKIKELYSKFTEVLSFK